MLPAIYNHNLERYHWHLPGAANKVAAENADEGANANVQIKKEPGVLFLNAPGLILQLADDDFDDDEREPLHDDDERESLHDDDELQPLLANDNEREPLHFIDEYIDNGGAEGPNENETFDCFQTNGMLPNDETFENECHSLTKKKQSLEIFDESTNPFLTNDIDAVVAVSNPNNPFLDWEEQQSLFAIGLNNPSIDNDEDIPIKTEDTLVFLNEPTTVIDLTDVVRSELAIDHEGIDSEDEIKNELDVLIKSGKVLPQPKIVKEEAEEDASGNEDARIAVVTTMAVDNTNDTVLGTITREVNVSDTCFLCLSHFIHFFRFQQKTKDLYVPEYNITIQYPIYTLLEFYNSMRDDLIGEYYDEKFIRIIFSGLKVKNHMVEHGLDNKDKLFCFIKGL